MSTIPGDTTSSAASEEARAERDHLDEKLLAEAEPYGGVLGALKLCLIALSLEPDAPNREKTLRDARSIAYRAIREARDPDTIPAGDAAEAAAGDRHRW